MSACAIKRWGTGTPCVKEPAAAKEMSEKLEQMRAERAAQDTMWVQPVPDTVVEQKKEKVRPK
jgi:hypothetical protein